MIKVLERPSIVLQQLVFEYNDNVHDSKAKEYADIIGKYPYIQISNTVIQTDNSIKVILYNDQFLPKIEVQFKDPTYRIIDPLFPTDNTILSVFIRSSSEILMPVRMDFKIIEFTSDKNKDGDNQEIIYTIIGILNVNNLYVTPFYSQNGTSFNILQTIASQSKLGFASNINNTSDLMTWINPGDTNINFIQDTVKCSYRSDESFMISYIDFYYNLNYIDIETSMNENISDQQQVTAGDMFKDNPENISDLYLTDHPDKMSSNQYINKYILNNSSTKVNLDIGYKTSVSYYDKNGNTYYKLLMDTISTPGKNGNNVILKGNVGEISELVQTSIDNVSLGMFDSDNVHKNFLYAMQQNHKNLEYLQKIKMTLSLKIINFNLYRFQKIKIIFYKLHELNTDQNNALLNQQTINNSRNIDYDEKRINQRLSGEWLIISISYTFNKIGGFSQDITLVKRELGFNKEDFNQQ
jgi:hypothetical protein